MIVLDVNLLIYGVNEDSPDHKKAKSWLEEAVSGTETVGMPWIILLARFGLALRYGGKPHVRWLSGGSHN
jgi:uncharacterized protein